LTTALHDSSVAARQIANNTRQQGIGVEQIVAALSEMSSAAGQAVAGTQAVEQATSSIAALSRKLDGTVVRFRVKESA
jgi:methyl-accepting chemotaxis protein